MKKHPTLSRLLSDDIRQAYPSQFRTFIDSFGRFVSEQDISVQYSGEFDQTSIRTQFKERIDKLMENQSTSLICLSIVCEDTEKKVFILKIFLSLPNHQ